MNKCYSHTLADTDPISLEDILGPSRVASVALQAAEANAGNIFFGDKDAQLLFIQPAGSTDALPFHNLKDVFIRGSAADVVIIMLFGSK